MLLDDILAELSEKVLQNAQNEDPCWLNGGEINRGPISSTPQETVAIGESSDDENSSLLQNIVKSVTSPEKEIKLPLESEEKFSKNLQSPNSECFSGFYGATASIPFQWEEKPGKPKNPSTEAASISLRLPPIRHSGLYSHLGDAKLRKKLPGRLKTIMQGRPAGLIKASKLSNERNHHRQEFVSDFANSDLESIYEEEEDDDEEEEMLELCTKTDPFRDFQEMHFRRSCDSSFDESTDQSLLRAPGFPHGSRRMTPKTGMIAKSAEFAPRRAYSYNTWAGFRSTELGLQSPGLRSLSTVDNPFSESPLLSRRSSVSDGVWPSISRAASNSDLASATAPALLANCLIPMMEMSNAVPVEDSGFCSRSPPKIIAPKATKEDRLENDGSWASLVQRSLSGQLMSTQKYHQKLTRAQSLQSAGSLNPLKRVSSMVKRTVWDSPRSLSMRSMEHWGLEKLMKIHMETTRHSVDNAEGCTDGDGSVIDHVFSPEGSSSCAFLDAESGSSTPFLSETSSNSCRDTHSFLDLAASGLQGSNSCKDGVSLLDFPTPGNLSDGIQAPSTIVYCPNNVQTKFEDGLTHGPLMKNKKPGDSSEKHPKGRNHTKGQTFCTPLRISVNRFWFLSGKHTVVKPIP